MSHRDSQPQNVGSTCRVLVIAGGDSTERAISLQSGECVARALAKAGHIVGRLDPVDQSVASIDRTKWDLAFPMLHGTGGEDGIVQRDLAAISLPWIGSSAESSALTFSKSLTRERLQGNGIRVAPGMTIQNDTFPAALQIPVVVKPDQQGSSVGVTIVREAHDWGPAVGYALSFGDRAVVESFIDGRELTVAVVDGEPLPPVEIVLPSGWYDYDAKYISEATTYDVDPPGLPADLLATAVRACEVCSARGILRVDFRVDRAGRAYVLEINTIPGMTEHSLVPKAAAAAGMNLVEFCDRCVRRRYDELSTLTIDQTHSEMP